ncbi:fibrinogen-like protein 1 isoform X1 [Hyla sarda]|uniref:fibrinogen-like protein 1 isoform X1 n=2 Tax=Hyla sarda TaxID=327740 RepID=UPI0024C43625|nr:fibrinogen-like protein 1 isoform X1 [Hyla sarda]XP_056417971.1 fibrinogen-like protein 1 isoform X1 [Hyla sarda]XP_056417972.1 fibrinogen-like protein 1 isoform X1 [Hyla sarda]XP_056417973.1 fibrinogen-like protein 1 isoform X1 [Hyla sarda]XP_056417974.1 fibrinogen-like protein 1 isoform X1 [Hyla sarda]XP_056417975.1 fibrinogen-like protein 1 isoform X1 [Hyla sarda]XP_056417976.1 fibrinogen-like protein 1 isoform X1 [Hyla sarda]XP_056417977.1 fibrinogen-like protein 1 isoform X1 [Hyla sa
MATMWLVFALLLPHYGLSAPRLKDIDVCRVDNAKLLHRIQVLENMLELGRLQLKDLKENNYHSVKSKYHKGNLAKSRMQNVQIPPTSGNLIVYDEDCSTVFERGKKQSGYYRVQPSPQTEPFMVYCDMSDGAGWTVIQRRSNGKVSFNRNWKEYKEGFGLFKKRNDEHWLGNDHIYHLLNSREMTLKIHLMDWHGNTRYAIYDTFRITNEEDKYKLWLGSYSGNAGDALDGGNNFAEQWSASVKGMPFSTADNDNDRYIKGNCAKENKCGWWFNRCHTANLNGLYYKNGNYTGEHDNGIVWSTWHGLWYSLKFSTMKIRRPSFLSAGSGDGMNV